jgi:hypothetical protein
MEKPKEEILVAPGWSLLIFGDGYLAQMQGGIEIEDSNGDKIVEETIKPSTDLKKRYNIKESDLDSNKNIQGYKMLKEDLIPLNLWDDANRTFLYIKNFNHEETNISNISWDLRKQVQEERKKRVIIEGYMMRLSEDLTLAKQNPSEYLSQGLEFFEKIQSGVLDSVRNKKGEEDGRS